jgi:preprotein translocase subunit SecA
VSKTIESAQSRVEGFNFDIRKRVVEYDDVINKQRETIYAERDKVLRNEDLTDTIRRFLDDEIDALVDQFVGSQAPDDWNMEGLAMALKQMGLEGAGTTEDELWELGGREQIADHLHELADAKLEEREREVGEHWSLAERFVLLQAIDRLWVVHLTELDDMRRGIGLRGYAQQDPLNEFRREAYNLYEELRGLIRHQVATTVFRVQVTRQQGAPAGGDPGVDAAMARGAAALTAAGAGAGRVGASTSVGSAGATSGPGSAIVQGLGGAGARGIRESLGDQPVGGPGAGPAGVRPGFTPSGARIGRNDPCYCGSGLKYKKCHGR